MVKTIETEGGTELAEIYKRISLELGGGSRLAKNTLWTELSEKEIICAGRDVLRVFCVSSKLLRDLLERRQWSSKT